MTLLTKRSSGRRHRGHRAIPIGSTEKRNDH